MHTHKETLEILGCSKMALSRYAQDGKLTKTKKGRRAYYDEHEVAALVPSVEDGRMRRGLEPKEKKSIELPKEVHEEITNISDSRNLDAVGYQYLAEATKDLNNLGFFEECDRQILVLYALNAQMYQRYLYASSSVDCISVNDSGTSTLHPHFKVMQHHEKQMLMYMDRLGLNPLSRTKLDAKPTKDKTSIMDILNDK